VRPWHLHGTYHQYGKKGAVDDVGVFEEWWISPTKYKRMFAGKNFSQIDYANGQGLFRAGAQDWPPGALMLLRETLIDPVPDPAQLEDFQLAKESVPAGQTNLECVVMTFPVRANLKVTGDFFPTACFDPKLPVLRIYSGGGGYRAVFDHISAFQGHYLAKEIRVYSSGEEFAELTIDTVEGLQDATDGIVSPPAEAKPVDLSLIELKEDSTRHYPGLLKKAVPEYPEMAKSTRTQGTVVLQATVAANGRLSYLKVISGPSLLQQAAIDSVRQWLYRPFEVMGEARPVRTEIKVIFSLG
jgi:TonB family protein